MLSGTDSITIHQRNLQVLMIEISKLRWIGTIIHHWWHQTLESFITYVFKERDRNRSLRVKVLVNFFHKLFMLLRFLPTSHPPAAPFSLFLKSTHSIQHCHSWNFCNSFLSFHSDTDATSVFSVMSPNLRTLSFQKYLLKLVNGTRVTIYMPFLWGKILWLWPF